MRAVVQKVSKGSVSVENAEIGAINKGFVVFLAVADDDDEKDLNYIVEKVCGLRIFEDENGKMNLSLKDVNGSVLAISQFTLMGDVRKGKRPSFSKASAPDKGKEFYDRFVEELNKREVHTETGKFQAHMMVEIYNDGPVTILLDSKKTF